jgi:hypothetical protein
MQSSVLKPGLIKLGGNACPLISVWLGASAFGQPGLYSADYKGDGLTKPATRLLEEGPSSPFG